MSNDVIKELLVAVLTKFDEASERRALDAVEKSQGRITDKEKKGAEVRDKNLANSLASGLKHLQGYTKNVVQLGERVALSLAGVALSIEGAAVSGTVALARLSKEMSQAYYSSQKLGSAVKDMDAFRYASEQAGSSAAKAQAGLEELGHLRNTNPAAYVGLLQRLGVAATDAAGKLRSPAQAAMDLAPALAKLPRQMQLLFGNQLGMDDDQTLAMVRPEFLAQIKQYQEMQKAIGFDPDKAASDGAKFQQIWTRMWTAVDLVSKKVQSAFFNQVGGSVDQVTAWLVKNSGRISDVAIKIGDYVLHLARSIVDLVTNFDKLNPSTQRLIEMLGGLGAALLLLKAGPIGIILALAGALALLWDDYEKYKQGLPSIVDWEMWEPRIKATIEGLTNLWNKFDALAQKLTGQDGVQVAFEAFSVFIAGVWVSRILGAFNAISGGWLATLARMGFSTTGAFLAAVALGASAESTPGAGVPADAAARAKVADQNRQDTDNANKRLGQGNGFWSDVWSYTKSKLGFGQDDQRVKDAILATADATKKMADGASGAGGAGGINADGGAPNLRYGRGAGGGFRSTLGSGGGAPLGQGAQGGRFKGGGANAAMAKESYDFWRSKGLDHNAALSMVSQEQGESGFNIRSRGDYVNGVATAHGIFQWHGDRRAAILRATGINVDTADHRQQLEAAYYEGTKGMRAGFLNTLNGRSLSDAVWQGVHRFEGSANQRKDHAVRLGMAQGWDGGGSFLKGPTATASVPAGASGQAVNDAEVFAARQRLAAGGNSPADRALVSRYLSQQNAPGGLDAAHQKLADAMKAAGDGHGVGAVPALHSPLGVTPSMYQSYDQRKTSSVSPSVHQKIDIHGVQDPKAIGDHLKHHAKRGVQDSIRNMQGQSA